MECKIEYWNRTFETRQYDSGGYYQATVPVVKEEMWFGTKKEIFKKFFHANNRLRYCNGSYYKFTEQKLIKEYKAFNKEYCTIETYYGNGIVD